MNWKFWKRKKFVPTKDQRWRYAKDGITKIPVKD